MGRSRRLYVHDEQGFTLIEVVVALFLLGIVAAAGLTFFIRGMQNTSNLARSQVAVGIANQAMESVRAVYPREVDTVNHVNGLIYGRSAADVDAAWATAAASDTAQSIKESDPLAGSRPSVASCPWCTRPRISDQPFTVTNIGGCYRATASQRARPELHGGRPPAAGQHRQALPRHDRRDLETRQGQRVRRGHLRLPDLHPDRPDGRPELEPHHRPVAYDDTTSFVTGRRRRHGQHAAQRRHRLHLRPV